MPRRPFDIKVILCRVRDPGNVGSVCRAMKTMGISRLVLADCPAYDDEIVARLSVHAHDVYENAARTGSLAEALSDCAVSAGFTRRLGERRDSGSLPVRRFAEKLAAEGGGATAGLVFGNEKDGLSTEELAECSLAVYIPTSDDFPSLNVAQAVMIACHELFEAAGSGGESRLVSGADGEAGKPRPADRAFVDGAVGDIVGRFTGAGFFTKSDDAGLRRILRNLFERALLSEDEVNYLAGVFRKFAILAGGEAVPRRKRPKKGMPDSD